MDPRRHRISLAIGIVLAMSAAAILDFGFAPFRQMLAHFDAELPLLTRLYVEGQHLFWGMPLLVPVAFVLGPRNRQGPIALLCGCVALLLIVPLGLLSMYLPIFSLAGGAPTGG